MTSSHELAGTGSCRLLALPLEIVALIFDFCEYKTLLNLSETCKSLQQESVLARRYHKIDVSVHNIGQMANADGRNITYYWSDACPPKFDVEKLARKQHAFLSDILTRPYVASLVQDFTWTLRSQCDPDQHRSDLLLRDAIYPDTHIWTAFQKLSNVKRLDLACHLNDWHWDYLRQPPDILFPAATSARLSGIMYRQTVEVIFRSIDLSCLDHLDLDNLQDPGRSHDRYPFHRPKWADLNHPWPPQEMDDIKFPGTMRGILPSLQGRCTRLRSFAFRKSGWWVHFNRFSLAQDQQCYHEVASFLSSVGPTLETFSYEQGVSEGIDEAFVRHVGRAQRRGVRLLPRESMRPMDIYFKAITTTLLHADWPVMRELSITGVRMDPLTKDSLIKCLGLGVEFLYQEVAERPCDIFMGLPAWEHLRV